MTLPTEPIGSIPRPPELLALLREFRAGRIGPEQLAAAAGEALRDTLRRFEATGSPVVTDGEQTKSSFATYPLEGLDNIAPDGVVIAFADGHARQLPRLTAGPFRYGKHAETYVRAARDLTATPLKQAVISASALSLIYPPEGIEGYPRERFLDDLVQEAVRDIRGCLQAGAHRVQIDFTEGRLAVKLDPSKQLLREFIALNNRVLDHFTAMELALSIAEDGADSGDFDPEGDLLVEVPVFAPVSALLQYRHPVHRLGLEQTLDGESTAPGTVPFFILGFRDANDEVCFIEISAATAHLIALIQTGGLSGLAALTRMAEELRHPDCAGLLSFGADILHNLRRQGAILGTQRFTPTHPIRNKP